MLAEGMEQKGSEPFIALAERYRPRLVAYARRILGDVADAEDVVQETLLRAHQAVEVKGSPVGWLYAVCYRQAVDRLRSRRRLARAAPALPTVEAGTAPVPPGLGEELRQAEAALHALEEPYRTALALRYLEGLEFRAIARRMGTIERTARTWVGRGLTALRRRLGGIHGL